VQLRSSIADPAYRAQKVQYRFTRRENDIGPHAERFPSLRSGEALSTPFMRKVQPHLKSAAAILDRGSGVPGTKGAVSFHPKGKRYRPARRTLSLPSDNFVV
jgi:hypothetical protein